MSSSSLILICQYFIHKNPNRQREIDFCLNRNIENKAIDKIVLLNEKHYQYPPFILNDKVKQIEISKRLSYYDFFNFIIHSSFSKENISNDDFVMLCNADIFFDEGIKEQIKQRYSSEGGEGTAFALLRYEYSNTFSSLNQCKLFGESRNNSQDTWIFKKSDILSSTFPKKSFEENRIHSDFQLGKTGCDNRIAYELKNYFEFKNVINPCKTVKSYHYQTSNVRDYIRYGEIPPPYLNLNPVL